MTFMSHMAGSWQRLIFIKTLQTTGFDHVRLRRCEVKVRQSSILFILILWLNSEGFGSSSVEDLWMILETYNLAWGT